MCDYCLRHGDGKKWYENEKNYSEEILKSKDAQEFLHDFFSRKAEERKDRQKEIIRLSKTPLWFMAKEKLEKHYRENLHHQLVPREVACDIVKMADRAVKMSCVCKKTWGKQEKLCIGLGFAADVADKYPDYTDGTEEISKGDACDFISGLECRGIVHSVSAMRVPYVGMICNCDLKYCNPYRSRLQGVKNAFYKSEFVFEIDVDRCDGCGECANKCLFGAIKKKNGILIDKEKCFGCGLCRSVCEQKAITTKEREGLVLKEKW